MYTAPLSDSNLYLSQHILLNVSNNRGFGNVYVAGTGSSNSDYQIYNATQQQAYTILTAHIGKFLSFQVIDSNTTTPVYGPQYSNAQLPDSSTPNNFFYQQNDSKAPYFGSVLLTWYQEETYQSPLNLYLPTLYGYNRLVYAFNDRFNNTIYAPLDVDIAKITRVLLNVTTNVSQTNQNQTAITITGRTGEYTYAGFNSLNSTFVPLDAGQVYLYYDENINYVGLNTQQEQLCAFGNYSTKYNTIAFPTNCTLANPAYIGRTANAGTINYVPEFNSSGVCSPPTNELLGTPLNCNIYGQDQNGNKISAACSPGADGQQRYCIPNYVNGTGTCTSQIGLIGVATTDANGGFALNTSVCGISQATVSSAYYGPPNSEPITVNQGPLNQSANFANIHKQVFANGNLTSRVLNSFAQPQGGQSFQAFNYEWLPNQTSILFQTGVFELSFGNIGVFALLVAMITVVIILLYKSTANTRRK